MTTWNSAATGPAVSAADVGQALPVLVPTGALMTEVIVPAVPAVFLLEFGAEEELAELGWRDKALCAQTDPEAFFPDRGGSVREAKRVCRACEVRAECLEYALEHDERFGVWGGMSERERRRLKRRAA